MSRHDATDEAAVMAEGMVDDYLEQAREAMSEMRGMPYHSNYTLEGGSNYREFLLKHPEFEKENKLMELEAARRRTDPEYNSYTYDYLTKQIDELNAEKAAMPEVFKGVDAHYGGEQGILASMRAKDRVGQNGEKILNIEEIQSDWHQQGREKGYGASGVPEGPFKKNWEEVALKKALNEAAKGGYDKLALTTGAEQADRYNLAKKIESIGYNPETGVLEAYDHSRKQIFNQAVTPDELPNYIGKEVTDKLFSTPLTMNKHLLSGQDISVGGEGMKGFYDKKLVNYLNDYGKKYGVNVGQVEADGKKFHSFDITPEMRADILKGQPLYSAIPSIGLLGTGYEDLLYQPVNEREKTNLLDW